MKKLMNLLAATLFLAFVSTVSFAQTEEPVCDGTGIPVQLNNGSGAGLHGAGAGVGLKINGGEFQETFKATLTEEQLAIIENIELTRDEKREALQATFTEAQQELYDTHMAEVAERQLLNRGNALSGGQMESAIKNGWQRGRN